MADESNRYDPDIFRTPVQGDDDFFAKLREESARRAGKVIPAPSAEEVFGSDTVNRIQELDKEALKVPAWKTTYLGIAKYGLRVVGVLAVLFGATSTALPDGGVGLTLPDPGAEWWRYAIGVGSWLFGILQSVAMPDSTPTPPPGSGPFPSN